MKPVFCGSFDYETRQSDLERLFSKYGTVDRVDMKSGFAFVYFDDERDAEDAIRSLDNTPFGYSKRRLSVEWSRGERGNRRDGSRSVANQKPTKTLFVINFDPTDTRIRDIEKHFEPYGKVSHVRIRRNFAFVQFETQEEATKALECTHMSKICGRVVSVEYALRDDSERGGDRRDSPRRGGREASRSRSRSPVRRRSRPSPDYGRAHSPVYDRYKGPSSNRDRSPDYGRYPSRSPVRRSLNGRSSASRSPVRRSPAARSPVRRRTRSPVRRTRSPAARSPVRRTRSPADRSPVHRTRSPADRSPVRRARSPADRSPVRRTRSPADRSPVRRSSVDRSPAGRSPNDRSPVRRSPDDRSPV